MKHINQKVDSFLVQSSQYQSTLDNPISLEEAQNAIKKLEKGKSGGVDGFFNEILKYGGDKVIQSLHKLYNIVFTSEEFPEVWSRGLIYPLFKGGPDEFRYDTGKYRGITLEYYRKNIYVDIK